MSKKIMILSCGLAMFLPAINSVNAMKEVSSESQSGFNNSGLKVIAKALGTPGEYSDFNSVSKLASDLVKLGYDELTKFDLQLLAQYLDSKATKSALNSAYINAKGGAVTSDTNLHSPLFQALGTNAAKDVARVREVFANQREKVQDAKNQLDKRNTLLAQIIENRAKLDTVFANSEALKNIHAIPEVMRIIAEGTELQQTLAQILADIKEEEKAMFGKSETPTGLVLQSSRWQELIEKKSFIEAEIIKNLTRLDNAKKAAAQLQGNIELTVNNLQSELERLNRELETTQVDFESIWYATNTWADMPDVKQKIIGQNTIVKPAFETLKEVLSQLTSSSSLITKKTK